MAKASNAAEAIRMIEAGEVGFNDIAGFESYRARNLSIFKDILQDPDFWYEDGGSVIFGKKYDDMKIADGFLAATIKISNRGNIGPLSIHPRNFTAVLLKGKDIKWYIVDNSASTKAAIGETAEARSDGIATTIPDETPDVKSETPKKTKLSLARVSVAPPTESEAFKRWFGDSKVVDENGKPLVVYHLTPSEFTEFRLGGGHFGKGVYLTTDPVETSYSNDPSWFLMHLYARIENPVESDALVPEDRFKFWRNQLIEDFRFFYTL